ncbi:MAG: hypothetical protein AB2L20_27950 [Mangrovibacterium sp.]
MERENEKVVALWVSGHAKDNFKPVPVNLEFEGDYHSVQGYDCINGVLQELKAEKDGNKARILGVLVKDYPTLIRINRKAGLIH